MHGNQAYASKYACLEVYSNFLDTSNSLARMRMLPVELLLLLHLFLQFTFSCLNLLLQLESFKERCSDISRGFVLYNDSYITIPVLTLTVRRLYERVEVLILRNSDIAQYYRQPNAHTLIFISNFHPSYSTNIHVEYLQNYGWVYISSQSNPGPLIKSLRVARVKSAYKYERTSIQLPIICKVSSSSIARYPWYLVDVRKSRTTFQGNSLLSSPLHHYRRLNFRGIAMFAVSMVTRIIVLVATGVLLLASLSNGHERLPSRYLHLLVSKCRHPLIPMSYYSRSSTIYDGNTL